ncbi:hypothetical protein [Nocardioides abyssi]|uniref:Uncharacterized protein n=1 Tax=Nocardioides abyssi TaxID=3058370 RepID=A0ABT8EYI8_9ACTN|nr:hypothetical protein [Nocardioides abyssi]MDN4163260.1 hypothetical protein [Nocardioides abyssi]
MDPRSSRSALPDVPGWWDLVLVALGLASTAVFGWVLTVLWTGGTLPFTPWEVAGRPLLAVAAFGLLAPAQGVATYVAARLLTLLVWRSGSAWSRSGTPATGPAAGPVGGQYPA